MIEQGVFSRFKTLYGTRYRTTENHHESTIQKQATRQAIGDHFQRQTKALPAGLSAGLPSKPFVGQSLWPRKPESPKRQVVVGSPKKTSPKASLEKDLHAEPQAPPIINPIPFERANSLLKALSTEQSPAAQALLKNGPQEGLQQLLLISNRLVSDVNGLRKQGRHNIRFVLYLHDPSLKAFRDPEFDTQNPDLSDEISRRYYFSKPQIMADQDRVHAPLRYVRKALSAPQILADNQSKGMAHLTFSSKELELLKATARSAGFEENEAHFNEYLNALFAQVETLYTQWLTVSQQDHSILPLRLGLYSDNLPAMRYIIRGKRKEPPTPDYKGWYRLDDPRRRWRIHEVTQLFPICDASGYQNDPAQARLNLESKIPFWYERKKPK